MTSEERFRLLKPRLEKRLTFPDDKIDETVESTMKALWFAAIGLPVSSEEAIKLPLPELNRQQTRTFYRLLAQRLNNKPLAHITGRQNFMGIEMICDYRALIPRKETEILGRKALELSYRLSQQKHDVKIIDVCCGAGNLGLALAYFNTNSRVYVSDISTEAIDLSRENIGFLNLEKRVHAKLGNLFEPFESEEFYDKVDMIVSNPPYISTAKVPRLDEQISSHEPSQAFDGGVFGINLIREIVKEAPKYLTVPGWLVFEVGVGQGPFVIQLCESSGFFHFVDYATDDAGNIRVIIARKK
jgi:release factor glutamine methyltransferase